MHLAHLSLSNVRWFLRLELPLEPGRDVIAGDNGEGLVGETDDKIITFFSLGVVVFFAVLVTVLSWLQSTLDKRKEQRKGAKVRDIVGW